jgi:hypothetical protein
VRGGKDRSDRRIGEVGGDMVCIVSGQRQSTEIQRAGRIQARVSLKSGRKSGNSSWEEITEVRWQIRSYIKCTP